MTKEQKIFFLNMDSQSAFTLCQEMLKKHNIQWINDNEEIILQGTEVAQCIKEIATFFGNNIVYGKSLEEIALKRLLSQNRTIATAESCTGGLLAYQFTKQSGASGAFIGGIISYANIIKEKHLKVDSMKLQQFGAVSTQVVSDMLYGAIESFGVDVALATSGVAGPSGGSVQKPVGTVFLGIQMRGQSPLIERHFFTGDRIEIQQQSCNAILKMLLKNL